MTVAQYIDTLHKRYQLGNATEHTFRGDLQQLLESLVPTISATNEPKRQACGAPDYILTQKDIPVGFIEAKDVGDKDLDGAKKTGNKEQFDRYKASLNNIIFTDYLHFHLYREGQFITKIAIGQLTKSGIKPLPQNFSSFENLIKDFCAYQGQTIKSSKKLAEMMAGKARLLADIISKALTSDSLNHEDSTLKDQMLAFKEILIHDITPQGFADVYAQTIAYGMFAARYHDPTLPTFSRQEAYQLIPSANPFLKKLFGYIAGLDVDDRIKWVVDDLVNIFLACNVDDLLKNYGKPTQTEDPIIHFYETFLSEYDPALRKARGVWYTPSPVVNFIVRATDDILKTEFNLPQGLADSSKTKVKINVQGKTIEKETHRVQILDPATGTGTFLAEIIKHIYKQFEGQQGIWSYYAETNLLPRLSGFELLMASYAMAHLKLDLLLTQTGYKPTTHQRFRVYLTNSLEESHPDTSTLFASWLSAEANEANHIKRDAPVMCVIGNPPYSVSSTNKGAWIERLVADYKTNLQERNIQPLSDDYIKFIRYGQFFVEKNGSGIVAYISNNSFLDGLIHRQMRKNLLQTFDKIYILDLHGSTKKNETAQDGTADQNLFDIMQGVSINIFVKTGKKQAHELGKVFHFDLYGKQAYKYDFLSQHTLDSVAWQEITPQEPNFFFVKKNDTGKENYEKGFKIDELFTLHSSGIKTHDDENLISFHQFAEDNQQYYYRPFDSRNIHYNLRKVVRHRFSVMRHLLKDNIAVLFPRQAITEKFGFFVSKGLTDVNYTGTAGQFGAGYVFPLYLYPETDYSAEQIHGVEAKLEEAKIILESFNKGFLQVKKMYEAMQNPEPDVTKYYKAQLKYQKKLTNDVQRFKTELEKKRSPVKLFDFEQRKPNLNGKIVNQIAKSLVLTFTNEKESRESTFAPIDVLDYIYAVLHSPLYREQYKEFLKIDFPRVPYPQDAHTFWQLVALGGELRQIHLLESPLVSKHITQYPIDGDNLVVKVRFQGVGSKNAAGLGRVYINDTQYFDNVPQVAWEFYIGGYQPAQKWLKDRKDRKLTLDDILHYQKIIVALVETNRLMKEIDSVGEV